MNFFEFLQSRERESVYRKPLIMGILNVTPDSFSDGGKFVKAGSGVTAGGRVNADAHEQIGVDAAVMRALEMIEEGAEIIDIGGESSGPGSKDVSLEEEFARVIPVVKKLIPALEERGLRGEMSAADGAGRSRKVFLSVDTYKAEVARQAIEAGADIINDVTALRGGNVGLVGASDAGGSKMAAVLAKYPHVPVIIMYSKDLTARTTRENTQYDDVIATVRKFLEERISYGVGQGISRERFIVDPGMGAFVSTDPKYSLEILRRLREFRISKTLGRAQESSPNQVGQENLPILIGASRKGFLGGAVQDRLEGSLACAAIAMQNGASILRVHDVKETRRFVDMLASIGEL